MTHLEQYLDLRNVKVSWAPWAVIDSSSLITKIQEFLKHSVEINFLHGFLGRTLWIIGMFQDSSFFMTTLKEADLWIKGSVNLIPEVGFHCLSHIFMCDSFYFSNLIVPRMFLQDIGKLWEGMLLNVGSKRKCRTRVHLRVLKPHVKIVVSEDPYPKNKEGLTWWTNFPAEWISLKPGVPKIRAWLQSNGWPCDL